MVLLNMSQYEFAETTTISTTKRGAAGFGSTDSMPSDKYQPHQRQSLRLQLKQKGATVAAATLTDITGTDMHLPHCNVELSPGPFLDSERITFTTRGKPILSNSNT